MHATDSFSACLCPLATQQLHRLVKGVSRRRDSTWGVKAEVLRWALFYTVATPRNVDSYSGRCSPGTPSGHVSGARPKGIEGDALATTLSLLRSLYPGGSMHAFIEFGLTHGAKTVFHVLTEASLEEKEALALSVCQLTYSDIRESGHVVFPEGRPLPSDPTPPPVAFGAPDLDKKMAEALALGATPSTIQKAAILLINEARSELERLEAPSPHAGAASIFGEMSSNLSAVLGGRRKLTQPRLALWHARWLLFLENVSR
jgi:hypothetical protein